MMAKMFTAKYIILLKEYNKIEYDIKNKNKQPSMQEYEHILEELMDLYNSIKGDTTFMKNNEIIENFVATLRASIIKDIRKLNPDYGVRRF